MAEVGAIVKARKGGDGIVVTRWSAVKGRRPSVPRWRGVGCMPAAALDDDDDDNVESSTMDERQLVTSSMVNAFTHTLVSADE
jgi:hypothetical protein